MLLSSAAAEKRNNVKHQDALHLIWIEQFADSVTTVQFEIENLKESLLRYALIYFNQQIK